MESLLEWLCRHFTDPDLPDLAEEAGATEIIGRIAAAVVGDRAALDTGALQRDLARLDEVLAKGGIDGPVRGGADQSYVRLAVGPGHPVVHVWTCPVRLCSRADLADGRGDPPLCSLTALPSVLIRLDT